MKSEPRLPELEKQSCWLLCGWGWGHGVPWAGQGGREKELLNHVCFPPGSAVQGQYFAEFDQNLRLHDPVFLQVPELRLIREQACGEAAHNTHTVFKTDMAKLCPLPVWTMCSKKGLLIEKAEGRVIPLWL